MITAFNDSQNCSWLANVACTDKELQQVDEKMLYVFFSTSTLLLLKPNLGKTGDPVTNVKNVFNVASLDDKMTVHIFKITVHICKLIFFILN